MQNNKALKQIIHIIIAAFLCVVTVICGQGNLSAFADTTDGIRAAYENTNVWDNLQGSIIGGNAFDIEDYPHNENGKPQMILCIRTSKTILGFMYIYTTRKTQRLTRIPNAIKYSFAAVI